MRALVRALVLLSLSISTLASGDAVPPPPMKCPAGQVGITSHRGPECVDEAPKSCPPGWRPALRGLCLVETCTADADCGTGKQCKAADICFRERLIEWGQAPRPRIDPFLLAAPPQHFDPPRRVIEPVDVCGADRSCPAESKCDTGKVCLPKGVAKPGAWKPKKK